MNQNLLAKIKYFLPVIVIVLFCIFSIYILTTNGSDVNITDARVDLSDYNYEDLSVYLRGEWLSVSSNTYVDLNTELSQDFSEEIILSLDAKLPLANKWYSIMLPRISGSIKFMVDDQIVFANGIYTQNSIPVPHIDFFSFFSEKSDINITIYFMPSFDGLTIDKSIMLGNPGNINTIYKKVLGRSLFIFIFLIIFSFFYFSTYHKSFFNLDIISAFILLCGTLIRSVIIGNILLGSVFRQLPYIIIYPLFVISTILLLTGLIVDSIYLFKVHKHNLPNKKVHILSVIIMIVCFIVDFSSYDRYFSSGHAIELGIIVLFTMHTAINLINSRNIYFSELSLTKSYNSALENLDFEKTNFLSSHLKPHFLFNALNIISGYALFDQEKSKEVSAALTTYFREFFEHCNLNQMNSLTNEIALLKSFGYIETERFPEISIKYNIPATLPDVSIPALTLQPLLENAVNHGIRKKSSHANGNVEITLEVNEERLIFIITDDGTGCDAEEIKKALDEPINDKSSSLCKINSQLKSLYNESLNIMSSPDKGTSVTFRIPLPDKK